MRRTRRTTAALVLTVGLGLSACGGEDAPELADVEQGVEDAEQEVSEQVGEGAEESDENG